MSHIYDENQQLVIFTRWFSTKNVKVVFQDFLRFSTPREWNLNLKNSDCSASKIIWNDTKLGPIFVELNIENTLFSIWMDIIRQTFHINQKMRNKIPYLLIPISLQGATGEIRFWMKNWEKIEKCGG